MKQGFSLLELSIVLVIIGLLAGGIVGGQSLVKAAELRSVIKEFEGFNTAVNTFRSKYNAIPGDMRISTRFWGRMNGNADCVTNSAAALATQGACDGNGNGVLEGGGASQSAEFFQFWRHLALAGLIEGTYSGIAGTASGDHAIIGTNVPSSKLNSAGWAVFWGGTNFGDADVYQMDYGNQFEFGAQVTNSRIYGPTLKPEEAWNIDTKLDDGKPAYGKIIARYWNNLCAAADDGSSAMNDLVASYRLSDSSTKCALYFRNAF